MHYFKLNVLLLFFFSSISFGQFFSGQDGSTMVADTLSAQSLPKIATTNDGGCFISWFDGRNKGYAVYLQRLNRDGEPLFPSQGLLVSGHKQGTSLVNYDLKVDISGNAILTFMDYRSGDPDIFVYKISSKGEFLWGKDGIALSGTLGFEADPKIAITEDGSATIAWLHSAGGQNLAMQRISPEGKKLWGEEPLYFSNQGESFESPQPVPSDSNSVIIIYNVVTGQFPQRNVRIAAEKFTAKGEARWGNGVVFIQSLGYVMPYTPPSVRLDGENGAVIAWHDDRDFDNRQVVYTQKLNSNGSFEFPLNGVEVAATPGNGYDPVAVRLGATKEVMVVWKGTDRSQSENGLYAQLIDERGRKKFGDPGMTIIPTAQQSISDYNLTSTGNAAYIGSISGNYPNKDGNLQLFFLNSAGLLNWGAPVDIARDDNGGKGRLEMVTDAYNSCFMAFTVAKDKGESVSASKLMYNGNPGGIFSPINLYDLHAFNHGPEVTIKWSTNHEEGKWSFRLERKSVDTEWIPVTEMKGTGGFYTNTNYEYTDKAPSDTRVVYRLIMKSYDGTEITRDLGQIVDTAYPTTY